MTLKYTDDILMIFNKLKTTLKGSMNNDHDTKELVSKHLNCEGGLPWWSSGKESAFQCRRRGFDPLSGN